MLIKVYGGTRNESADSLCESCHHSRIVRGRSVDEEIVFCDAAAMQSTRITFKVTSCSDYLDSRLPSIGELCEKAWVLTAGTRRRAAGFVRGSDLREREATEYFNQLRRREKP